ncbi:MAG: hypothetical protein ACT4PU_05015 [Planctomycetota bacterium]
MAVGLLLASSGVLYPIHGSILEAKTQVQGLDAEIERDAAVHHELMAAHAQMLAVRQRVSERASNLCPNTPEGEHEFETALLQTVQSAGLNSYRMDRRSETREGTHPSLTIELVVDGDAFALQRFLLATERLPWVTRILSIAVEPGNDVRRMTLQVAVMLEPKS